MEKIPPGRQDPEDTQRNNQQQNKLCESSRLRGKKKTFLSTLKIDCFETMVVRVGKKMEFTEKKKLASLKPYNIPDVLMLSVQLPQKDSSGILFLCFISNILFTFAFFI